jgi:hypothetical protein
MKPLFGPAAGGEPAGDVSPERSYPAPVTVAEPVDAEARHPWLAMRHPRRSAPATVLPICPRCRRRASGVHHCVAVSDLITMLHTEW